MFLEPATVNEIINIVLGLKSSSSARADSFPSAVVKFIHDFAFFQLLKLSFECGIYPYALKRAWIIVLYKDGSGNDQPNYHQISTLTVVRKIFDEIRLSLLIVFLSSIHQ